jgi:hypothetical protein
MSNPYSRLDKLFSKAFNIKHPAMLDWTDVKKNVEILRKVANRQYSSPNVNNLMDRLNAALGEYLDEVKARIDYIVSTMDSEGDS